MLLRVFTSIESLWWKNYNGVLLGNSFQLYCELYPTGSLKRPRGDQPALLQIRAFLSRQLAVNHLPAHH